MWPRHDSVRPPIHVDGGNEGRGARYLESWRDAVEDRVGVVTLKRHVRRLQQHTPYDVGTERESGGEGRHHQDVGYTAQGVRARGMVSLYQHSHDITSMWLHRSDGEGSRVSELRQGHASLKTRLWQGVCLYGGRGMHN